MSLQYGIMAKERKLFYIRSSSLSAAQNHTNTVDPKFEELTTSGNFAGLVDSSQSTSKPVHYILQDFPKHIVIILLRYAYCSPHTES